MPVRDPSNHNDLRDTSNQRQRSAPHPRYNLQKAEALAKIIFDQGARHCDPDRIARAVGYKNSRSGPFKGLKAASSYFGLVDSGRKGSLSLTQLWIDTFHHAEDLTRLKKARRDAMDTPDIYKQLLEEYKDRQLPDVDKLERELYLNQKYQILKDAAPLAAQTFLESASYAGLIDSRGFLQLSDDPPQNLAKSNAEEENGKSQQEISESLQSEPELEEYLETQLGTSKLRNPSSSIDLPHNHDELDRIEIKLRGGKKAFIHVPSPLTREDKDRLKAHIDLVLEPEEEDAQ